MTELEIKIKKAAQDYYTDGTSEYTDEEFDALVEQLRHEIPNSELLQKVGWGYDTDSDTTPGEKVKHRYGEAGSLDKFHNYDEMKSNFKSIDNYDISLKLDGLSVVLYYKDSYLYQALTRGDGIYGIDITNKIKLIMPNNGGIHLKSDKRFTGAIRGEIIMSYDSFNKFKKLNPDAKNPRNSAVGLINTPKITPDLQFLDVVIYSLVGAEDISLLHSPMSSKLLTDVALSMLSVRNWLTNNFEYTVNYINQRNGYVFPTNQQSLDSITTYCRNKWYGRYPADGLVFSTNSVHVNDNSHEVVQTAIAFKFPAEKAETKVKNIEWNLTKTGYLQPRIEVDTVELSGTNVSFCTGYNAKYIKDNEIGIGTTLEISKHGEIIPNVDSVIEASGCNLPIVCPHCGEEIVWNGVNLQCINPECGGTSLQDLLVWLQCLAPIDGLGDKIKLKYLTEIIQPIDGLTVKNVMEFGQGYQLIGNGAKSGSHFRMVLKMLANLYNDDIKLVDAIKALNIPRFGDKTAEKLAMFPEALQQLYNSYLHKNALLEDHKWWETLSYKQQIFADLIGEANAKSLIENIDKLDNIKYIYDRIIWEPVSINNIKAKVAITGKLSVKRSDFEKELKQFGYIVGDISKDTKFLITDNPNSNSSKNIKADKLGIVKITEADFRSKYM
jgi:DNA ligase (NAD+)